MKFCSIELITCLAGKAGIHNNPVEAGFVKNPSDWLFSSAGDYEGEKGEIDIYFLD